MDHLEKDFNNNLASFDRTDDNELKKAEGMAQKRMQFRCLRNDFKYEEWQCTHTFVSKVNRDRHEANLHPGQKFYHA